MQIYCCMMETLQTVVEKTPQPMLRESLRAKEVYGDAGDQGSPIPGETASSPSYFQHSPSLPASGLTEFSGVDSASRDVPLEKPSEPSDLKGFTSVSPQKQYVGVRVKMPVRELLRKIRLSKGIDANNAKEISAKAGSKTSGTAEKKRAYSERRHKQNRHHTQAALKSVEELDILVEVLQEDLNKSQTKLALELSMPDGQGPSLEHPLPWKEGIRNPPPENSWEPIQFQPHSSSPSSGALLHLYVDNCHGFNCGMMQQSPNPGNIFQNSCEEERRWQRDGAVRPSGESFQGFAKGNPPGIVGSELLEDHTTTLNDGKVQRPTARSFIRRDASAISFFQFQLHREETRLRNIPVEKLLAPDNHGNRLLHVAVMQGRRALAYALALRFAHLNKINERDAAKQTALHIAAQKNHHLIVSDLAALGANINARDASGKTPLHLCAEKGYLAVLEVLKKCQQSGTHVQVDATDHQGLTPLQGGALAHATLVKDLENQDLSLEIRKALTLRKDQILRGIHCLMEMGADPWVQGTKSSDQASHYFAKVHEDKELMSLFQICRPRWPEDFNSLQGREAGTLLYLQAEETEPPTVSFSSILGHFLESAM